MDSKLKILISDDDKEFCARCTATLRGCGFDTSIAPKDGHLMLEMIKDYQPDVVLTDVFMQKALIETDDGYLKFVLNNKNPSREVSGVLKGLYLHLEQLSEAYPSNVKVTVTEV